METHQNSPPGIDPKTFLSAYSKALLYAERKLAKYKNSGLVGIISPEDVTHEAVLKVLNRERPWNQAATPDLFVHLAGCINSIISNNYTSSHFRQTDRSDPDNQLLRAQAVEQFSIEDSIEFESKVTFIIDFLSSAREDLKQIAELMLKDGVTEPKEIAESLGMTVKEVNTLKVVIKRTMQRANFTLHYIAENRQDLIYIANAIYKNKATSADELSEILQVPAADVREQRRELYRVINEIRRGLI